MCFATMSAVRLIRRTETYGFDVSRTVRNDDVSCMGLFVYMILVRGFHEGKVLLENPFEMASPFIDVSH